MKTKYKKKILRHPEEKKANHMQRKKDKNYCRLLVRNYANQKTVNENFKVQKEKQVF